MTVRSEKEQTEGRPQPAHTKKTFVEPAMSSPVDVLEATTFFQTVDSGGTGFKKKGGGN